MKRSRAGERKIKALVQLKRIGKWPSDHSTISLCPHREMLRKMRSAIRTCVSDVRWRCIVEACQLGPYRSELGRLVIAVHVSFWPVSRFSPSNWRASVLLDRSLMSRFMRLAGLQFLKRLAMSHNLQRLPLEKLQLQKSCYVYWLPSLLAGTFIPALSRKNFPLDMRCNFFRFLKGDNLWHGCCSEA